MLRHDAWSCMIKNSSNSYPCVNHSWSMCEHAWTMCAHIKSIAISFSQMVALVSLSLLSTALKRSLSFSPPVFTTITFLAGSYTSLCVIPAASVTVLPSSLSTTQPVALVSITFHTGSYTTWACTAPLLASKMWSKVIDKCGKSMLHMIRNSNLMYGSILVIFIILSNGKPRVNNALVTREPLTWSKMCNFEITHASTCMKIFVLFSSRMSTLAHKWKINEKNGFAWSCIVHWIMHDHAKKLKNSIFCPIWRNILSGTFHTMEDIAHF